MPGKKKRSADDRRLQLIQICYRLIATKGFEGFRTREVAAKAHINDATLTYYFPDKEALVQGVLDLLLNEIISARTGQTALGIPTAREEIRFEFNDIRKRIEEKPLQFLVLSELWIRARRDQKIAKMLKTMDEGWTWHLRSILQRGIEGGEFRSDLEIECAAKAIIAQLKGIGYHTTLEPGDLDSLVTELLAQTEAWLLADPSRNSSTKD